MNSSAANHFRPPFLDRLLEGADERRADGPSQSFGRADLLESIRLELTRLLNTRGHLREKRFNRDEVSVTEYGLADLLQYCPQDPAARNELGREVARVIEAFEPRLSGVSTAIQPSSDRACRCQVEIAAQLRLDRLQKPVIFQIAVGDPAA